MVLGDVEETVTTIEMDEETFEEIYKVWGRYWSHRRRGYRRLSEHPISMVICQGTSCNLQCAFEGSEKYPLNFIQQS